MPMKHPVPESGKRLLGYRRSDGRWQIKINGVPKTFGSRKDANDPTLSIEERYARAVRAYDAYRARIAGFKVKEYDLAGLTLRELGNRYLDWMDHRITIGQIRPRNYLEIKHALVEFTRLVGGGDRLVSTLTPADFARARVAWSDSDPYTLSRKVAWVRSWFIWAEDEDHVEHRPKFGKLFGRSGIKALRERMVEQAAQFGDKAFTPAEVQQILPALGWEMRAPFLLGLNCAFYAEDVSQLDLQHLDLDHHAHWLPRGKNQNFRIGWLWDITVEAIRDYISRRWTHHRSRPRLTVSTPIFVTKYRNPFVHWHTERNDAGEIIRCNQSNNGTKELSKILKRLKIHREGVGFGCLRHTFITLADDLGKDVEVALVAGHKRPGVIEFYVRKYSRDSLCVLAETRIRPVAEAVRAKLGI